MTGFIETEMSATLSEDQKNNIYMRISMKQAVNVNYVAETIMLLFSDEEISVSGSNIHVNNEGI